MKMIAAIFPGQGSQYVGMVKELLTHFPAVRPIFEEASDSIGLDIAKLCLNESEATLQLTFNAQPCILTTSIAWFRVLENEKGLRPVASAGHSLGEYSALVASGALPLFDAVRLVRLRGELMQEAVPKGHGKMAALIGLVDSLAIELCEKASMENSIVVPANFNSPGQIVIAGHTAAVERAEKLAGDRESRYRARKVIPLNVSAPFHCPLMKPVAEKFEPALRQIQWKPLGFPVIANVDATPHSANALVDKLTSQIYSPVRWTECAATLVSLGCDSFVEPGPGKVLTGLVKRCLEDVTAVSIDTFEDFKKLGELS